MPITNYGLTIAYSAGHLRARPRSRSPAALEAYRQALRDGDGHGQPEAVTAELPDDVAVDDLC